MRRSAPLLLSVLALVVLPAALRAQDGLNEGDRVRVMALPPQPSIVIGTMLDRSNGHLTVQAQKPDILLGAHVRIPVDLLTRLEVSRGYERRSLLGAGIGLLVGSAASILIWTSMREEDDDSIFNGYVWAASAGLGALLGAGIGSTVKVEHWAEMPIADLERASVARLTIQVSVSTP